jgi:para-aminobenzoate synthetase
MYASPQASDFRGINPRPLQVITRISPIFYCLDELINKQLNARPIKGTVQKKPGVAAEMALTIFSSSKERAENLMIVDLTRHQLHGVYGSENVRVTQLMEVEEYETLWQLVSVVDAVPSGTHKPTIPEDWESSTEHSFKSETERHI